MGIYASNGGGIGLVWQMVGQPVAAMQLCIGAVSPLRYRLCMGNRDVSNVRDARLDSELVPVSVQQRFCGYAFDESSSGWACGRSGAGCGGESADYSNITP